MPVTVTSTYYSGDRAGGVITVPGRQTDIWFQADAISGNVADALLAIALPAAMRLQQNLVVEGKVSAQLLRHTSALQSLLHDWDPALHVIEIQAQDHDPGAVAGGPVALCFTGGVDSLHAALQTPSHSFERALLYVHGLDIALGNTKLRHAVSSHLRSVAAELGRPLIEMESNLRVFTDRYQTWHMAFGGALAACAMLLAGNISALEIAAGDIAERLMPDGAHPSLNCLFSTEQLAVRTVGTEVERVEKVRMLADQGVAHRHLRVCWENRGNAYNCGACEKCLRTMATLEVYGALDHFNVFDLPLDYRRLSRAVNMDQSVDFMTQQVVTAARQNSSDKALIHSIERCLVPHRARRLRMQRRLVPAMVRNWHYRFIRWRERQP